MEVKYDIKKIMEIIPHRYPMLLIDRVVELHIGKSIKALKNVTISEPFFQGHFPGEPIMPGVMILESMVQAGAILTAESSEQARERMIYFMSMDKVKFRKPVNPGDQLICEMEILNLRTRAVKMRGKALVNGGIAAQGEFYAVSGGKE